MTTISLIFWPPTKPPAIMSDRAADLQMSSGPVRRTSATFSSPFHLAAWMRRCRWWYHRSKPRCSPLQPRPHWAKFQARV